MDRYFGTKEILAHPMTRGEYNEYRGWDMPVDEDQADEGYLVEYLNSPNSNHENHSNYISWSPKNVFDKSYRKTDGLTFGQAIECLKVGKKVARAHWGGYWFLEKGAELISRNPANGRTGLNDIIITKLKDLGGNAPATAYQEDMLAEDWRVVE